jgi:hypothetical protein
MSETMAYVNPCVHAWGPWYPYGARQEYRRCSKCGHYEYRLIQNPPS